MLPGHAPSEGLPEANLLVSTLRLEAQSFRVLARLHTAAAMLLVLSPAVAQSQTASVSVSPAAVTGTENLLRLSFRAGSPIRIAQIVAIGTRACVAQYDAKDRKLVLIADDGVTRLGPLVPGVAGRVQNSYCGVSQLDVTSAAAGAELSISMQMALTASGSYTIMQSLVTSTGSSVAPTPTGNWTVPVPVTVGVLPSAVVVTSAQTQQFSANVSGTTNTAVIWAATGGTISPSGLFTAPVVSADTAVTVTATSAADATKKAAAAVTVRPNVSVSVTPGASTLMPSKTLQLIAGVTGTTNSAVTWTLSSATGTLSVTGSSAVYTAPSVIERQETVEVTVRSAADPMKVAKAVITLVPVVALSMTPQSVELKPGASQQFVATVSGSSNTAVEWKTNPAIGTLSSSGLYTAPVSDIQPNQEVMITATALADPTKTATARVRFNTLPDLTYTVGLGGLTSLKYKGVEYNYKYGEGLITAVSFQTAQGVVRAAPSCTGKQNGDQLTYQCTQGGRPFTVIVTYTACPNNAVCADFAVTNNSSEPITEVLVSTFGISTSTYKGVTSGKIDSTLPVGQIDLIVAKAGLWIDTPARETSVGIQCGWSTICKNQMMLRYSIAPNGGRGASRYCMRMSSEAYPSLLEFLPEAYKQYQSSWPDITNWPDRRPIMAWWIADTGKRSAINPRGYMQDPNLNVSDSKLFATRVLDRARSFRDQMNALPVKPQGLILWDIEGQEFIHPTTYIGDPRVFQSGYAPEMNAIADQVFATFRDSGYRVGVTLRPQYMQWGTTLPATCKTNSYGGARDYFIKVDAPFRQSFHGCYDHGWAVVPDGNGSQTEFVNTQRAEVLSLLRSKAQYARQRWGVTLFYVDSAVYTGGGPIDPQIFRTLKEEFPDCLFIPEQENIATLSATMPFADVKNSSDPKFGPLTWRWAYPNAAFAVKWNDCTGTCWTQNLENFKIGQKIGDIALLSLYPQISAGHLETVNSTIQEVRREMSNVFVTDSVTGRKLSFSGTPDRILAYPVKLRVYFAGSEGELTSSGLFCEAGQWMGENSCTLDLSASKVSQIRYVDFAGKTVRTDAPQLLQ